MYIPRNVRILRALSPLFSADRYTFHGSSSMISGSNTLRAPCCTIRPQRFFSVADLKNRLSDEMKFESENDATNTDKEFIDSYLAKNYWKVEEIMGGRHVKFIKNHGKNKITIIMDVSSVGEENGKDYQDEEYDDHENDNEADEDPIAENDTLPATMVVEIPANPEKGAIKIDLAIQDEEFYIQRVEYFKTSKQAFSLIQGCGEPEMLYTGPQFYTLDNDIQKLYNNYIYEIGLDPDFARFVYSYSIAKEHKEYTSWLKKTHNFFEE